MSIVQRPQPCATKYSSHGASTSRSVFPGSKCSRKIQKPSVLMRTLSRTDSSSSSHLTMRAWSNGDVPVDELGSAVERGVVAHRHHVVEAVDADALAAHLIGEPLAGAVDEHLLVDPRRAVLADVARLAREDDRRLAVDRQQHVGVAVHDHEAAEIRHRALEAGVLVAAHDHGVEAVARRRLADRAGSGARSRPAADRCTSAHLCCHDSSTPFTSAQIASFSGVGTPCSRPKRTIPPFR